MEIVLVSKQRPSHIINRSWETFWGLKCDAICRDHKSTLLRDKSDRETNDPRFLDWQARNVARKRRSFFSRQTWSWFYTPATQDFSLSFFLGFLAWSWLYSLFPKELRLRETNDGITGVKKEKIEGETVAGCYKKILSLSLPLSCLFVLLFRGHSNSLQRKWGASFSWVARDRQSISPPDS